MSSHRDPEKRDFWYRLFHEVGEGAIRFRRPAAALVLVATLFFAYQAKDLTFNNAHEIWFIERDPSLALIQKFRDRFGNNDDFVLLLIESRAGFSPHQIGLIARLAEELGRSVPYLLEVDWLGAAEVIQGMDGHLTVSPLMADAPKSTEGVAEFLGKALADPMNRNRLISADGKTLGLILEIDRYPSTKRDPKKDIAPRIRAVLADPVYGGLKVRMVGTPVLHFDFDRITARESLYFFIFCFLADMAVLALVAKSLRAVVATALIIGVSLVTVMGTIAMAGFTLNVAFILIPTLMVCVGIGDAFHVITEFQDRLESGRTNRSAMCDAIGTVGLACLLTTLTTAAGFMSFLSVGIRPLQQMGLYAAIGVCVAFIMTLVIVPCTLGREGLDFAKLGMRRRGDPFDRMLKGIHRIVVHHPGKIILFFVTLSAFSLLGARHIEVETNTVAMLLDRVPIRQAYEFVDDRMGGSMSLEIMVDTQKPDGMTDPVFVRGVERFQQILDRSPLTTQTFSIVDILKKLRRAAHPDEAEGRLLPESREAIAQYLLLYETSGGKYLERLVSFNHDMVRITARTRSLDTKSIRTYMAEVKRAAAESFDTGVKVELTGSLAWLMALNDLVKTGQKKSFAVAFGLITLIMMAVMRSVVLGIISMVPNVFPVLLTLGLMGFTGMYMDVEVMTTSAIIIGVAVDDTIHFFTRYKTEFSRSGGYSEALERTLATVGRPIAFTTLVLLTGLSLLAFSQVLGIVKFGLLSGFAFFWALVSDFFFGPALIMVLKPMGPERKPAERESLCGST